MVVKIHLYLLLVFAYMYALGNLETFIISYVFIILHEIAHILVAKLLGVKIYEVEMLPVGINAKYTQNISSIKELAISMAGPCASFLFYFFLSNPILKNINLMIGIANLIPLKPYDGGRILSFLIAIIAGEKNAKRVNLLIQKLSLKILFILSIFSVIKLKNYYITIACIYMICIVKEELKNERFYDLIKYLQID